ncbi:MAG: hypothetical protein LBP64_05060 [Tannerella sp.]|nr:hypothetical protein [Tannerella sp.]
MRKKTFIIFLLLYSAASKSGNVIDYSLHVPPEYEVKIDNRSTAKLNASLTGNAPTRFGVSESLWTDFADATRHRIITALDSLLSGIDRQSMDTTLIDRDNYDFNRYFFSYLRNIESKDTVRHYFKGQLINLYPIAPAQYSLTLLYANNGEIGRIYTFIAKDDNGKFVFSSPVKYNTQHWKTTAADSITIYYPDTINLERAREFDRKNVLMASKFNLPVKDFEMYMCRNYQEVLQLQGCLYESGRNGVVNEGDIIDPKTLFSIKDDEDFSHDVLHMYAAHIRGKVRNRAAEEGLAYLWGNAYWYIDGIGKIPDQPEMVAALRQYLAEHSEADLLNLFDESPYVLTEYGYPKPVYLKYIIAGVICEAIEKQKGVSAIMELIKCGLTEDDFFKATDKLININRNNFDVKVRKLLSAQ